MHKSFSKLLPPGGRLELSGKFAILPFIEHSSDVFSRSNVAVSYKTPGFFKRQKEAQAEVSIWERSLPSSSERTENYERRILIRWKNSSADSKWITGTIISASYPPLSASMTRNFTGTYPESVGPGSATALIPVSHVVRGGRIDIVDMKALGGKPKEMSDLRISFSSARGE